MAGENGNAGWRDGSSLGPGHFGAMSDAISVISFFVTERNDDESENFITTIRL